MRWVLAVSAMIFAISQVGCDRGVGQRILTGVSQDSSGIEIVTIGPVPSLTDPDFLWELELVRSLSTVSSSGEPIVFNPSQLLPLEQEVIVVDAAGEAPVVSLDRESWNVRWRIGRFGEGPDELGRGLRLVRLGSDIGLVDLGRKTVRVLGRDGREKDRSDLSLSERLREIAQGSSGEIFAEIWVWRGIGDLGSTLFTFDTEGPGKEIGPVPPPGISASEYQDGRGLWVPVADGVIVTHSMNPTFSLIDTAGVKRREIRLELTPREMTEAERNRRVARDGMRAARFRLAPMAMANEMYALSDTIFGTWHARLWRAAEDSDLEEGARMLRLISTSGNYLGAAYLPPEFLIRWAEAGSVWGTRLDSLGTPLIEQYTLRPPGAN